MDTSEFREVFAAEARDYLQSLNDDLLLLENDPHSSEILDDMFRAAHSLKGMAGTMGFEELAHFTHQMESVLDLLRTGELEASDRVINVLFSSVDTLEILLEQTINDEPISSFQDIVSALQRLSDPQAETTETKPLGTKDVSVVLDEFNRETIKQGLEQGYNAYQVLITLRPNTLLKSVRVYTIFQALEEVGTIIQCNPSAQDLEEERFDNQFALIILTHESAKEIQAIVEGISEIEQVQVSKPDDVTRQESASALEVEPRIQSRLRTRRTDKFVRVETDRLDKLINLVGELVISRTQVMEIMKQLEDSEQKNAAAQLDRVTTELQYAAMNLRMVPIKQVFDRFPRMVRDLAKASQKEINLEIYGEETELDRGIVNQIGDPLVHLIRNSIDHGIEPRAERIAKGKPEVGTIRLGARHEGSHILIEIEDDGQGLDVEKIRQKAVTQGLVSGDAKITIDEAANLLFHPGFSTADAVTDLSGRGVGMDAVKAAVESLSGTVDVQSQTDQYMRVTIKLPLTLAIIKALLVVAGGETFAIPIQAVRENIQIERSQVKTVQQHDVIVLRNEVLPLYNLAECLGFEPIQSTGPLAVIIVESRGQKVGFIVEDLIGQQEIVIESLSDILGDIRGIAGATILGSGRVALILDNSTLIQ
ncbi:MAG: chemotaxis protein CheA [Firmicutes bacterium]|nr:chemotaxis protein CheA [Bacillota bacterium]